ncbi:hypothetical protein DAVIS_01788 [Mycobacterium marinum]|uniref:Uncharacterized protein n=1 Tax=Mycobacterium marinum TaxID=1781 RepID=A0A3E2MY60_MYCMR|nr:hypothetical protein DAVIS_01788 [Mycobacterium marinum]
MGVCFTFVKGGQTTKAGRCSVLCRAVCAMRAEDTQCGVTNLDVVVTVGVPVVLSGAARLPRERDRSSHRWTVGLVMPRCRAGSPCRSLPVQPMLADQ